MVMGVGVGDRRSHSGFAWASHLPALRLPPMAGDTAVSPLKKV